jgi:hypothetical protein
MEYEMSAEMKNRINTEMEEMICRAEREGRILMWLGDMEVLFFPSELREQRALGNFLNGPQSWELLDPKAELAGFEAVVSRAAAARDAFVACMRKNQS